MSRSLQFDIVANDKASAKLKDVQSLAGKFGRSIGGMVSGFFAIENVINRIVSFGQQSFNWASNLKESADAVGLTVVQFQQLEYAAGQAGVPVEKMQKAFLDLRKTMRDAQDGNGQAIAVFKALGYTQDQIANGNIDVMDAFLRVSKAVSAASTEQEKFNIATAVFGDKVAMDLIKVLGNYAELKQNIAETPLITNEEAEELDKFNDRLDATIAKMRVMFARKFTSGGGEWLTDLLTPGASAAAAAAGFVNMPATTTGPEPVTQQDKDAAAALAEAGRKKTAAAGLAAGQPAFSSLATIGGAAGAVRGAGPSPELTALEKIEENTRPAMPVPANGSTDFSKGSGDAGFDAAAARARTIPTYGEYFARAARRAR